MEATKLLLRWWQAYFVNSFSTGYQPGGFEEAFSGVTAVKNSQPTTAEELADKAAI